MKKINNFSIFAFFVGLSVSSQVFAHSLPTYSIPETGQEIASYVSEASKTKSEIESTQELVIKMVLLGVPGYMSAIKTGDMSGIMAGMAVQGYELYKFEAEKKKQAKEKAQKEAQANAQEKLQAQEEANQATKDAVDENRKTAAENRKANVKKKLSFVGNWLNKKDGKNKQGVNAIANGLFGEDSTISSAIGKATDKLSAQADTSEEETKKDAGDAKNKPSES